MLLQQSPFRGEDEDEIYDAILADEPLYPIHMPRDSVSILQKLLTREPELRLGSGPTDAQEIMSHAFFRNINWDDVYHKRIPAPFIPQISNPTDTSNFDTEFTSVTPVLTPVQSGRSPYRLGRLLISNTSSSSFASYARRIPRLLLLSRFRIRMLSFRYPGVFERSTFASSCECVRIGYDLVASRPCGIVAERQIDYGVAGVAKTDFLPSHNSSSLIRAWPLPFPSEIHPLKHRAHFTPMTWRRCFGLKVSILCRAAWLEPG